MSGLSRELANDEIFGQVIFQPLESANRLQHAAPRSDRGTYREVHAFQQARNQRAAPKIRIHSGCFQTRPETRSRHSPVGAGRNAKLLILKFRSHGLEKRGVDADVAVAHDYQFVCRHGQHALEAIDLRVGIRRLSGDHQSRCDIGILPPQALNNSHRRILFVSDREQNFERRIFLLEKRTQIRFQLQIQSGKRFQNTDWLD